MAANRPTGTATIIAMTVIRIVPANTGIAPNAPDAPTWSARMAVCGLHSSPNRKSIGEILVKKAIASNSSDRTIPTVVRMAMVEATISMSRMTRSTRFRARMAGVTLR